MRRVYGKVSHKEGWWKLEAEPHLMLRAKRVFGRVPESSVGSLSWKNTPETCADLKWFMTRYPLAISDRDRALLLDGAKDHEDKILRLDRLIDRRYKAPEFALALPPRNYQKVAGAIAYEQGFLLLADDLGSGKTISAFCLLAAKGTLPAVVVTLSGTMPEQWQMMSWKFIPQATTHVVKRGTPYPLPMTDGRGPDIVILNYHKLHGWAQTLAAYAKTIIFDEGQELRRSGTDKKESKKYAAAKYLARRMAWRMALSATPVFNLGGEIWNIIDVLKEDVLGTREEFWREWCEDTTRDRAPRVVDPKALGTHLRAEHIMLRRTRKELGRELPQFTKIPQYVESDENALDSVKASAAELAKIILSKEKLEGWDRMKAAEEFTQMLRQATGVAKAPYCADFIRLLVEGDNETVLVAAWHRAVYDVLLAKLKDLNPVMFTGSETPAQKAESMKKFMKGETKIMLMSLRAGQGVDGLQQVCRTVVFAELDWSPAIHDQVCGRILRDGQKDPVTAYYLVADRGSDPTVAETLGLKTEQLEGIRNPDQDVIEEYQADPGRIRKLAERYLARRGKMLPEEVVS
jgi:hypothetical protein